jgi:anthranilate synthase component 2
MILLIDNYDSFTYNLLHYLSELGAEVEVVRNDMIKPQEIAKKQSLKGIVLSPGPCTPNEAGICLDVIKQFSGIVPILGVCLGHQAICQAFGGKVIRAPQPIHGKVSQIVHSNRGVFKDIPSPFQATRYHSLIAEKETLPDCLDITAETQDGLIMGLEHKTLPVHGVQFHPESIASEHGHHLLKNFLEMC